MAPAVLILFITEGTVLVKPPALPLLAHVKKENGSVTPSCILMHHHAHQYQEACLPGLRIVNILVLEKYSYKDVTKNLQNVLSPAACAHLDAFSLDVLVDHRHCHLPHRCLYPERS